MVKRLITGDQLTAPPNAPWCIGLAPGDFGKFRNDLLAGNFGDGKINSFDPATCNYLGTLSDGLGYPIVCEGLLALTFGNCGNGGAKKKLYFTAELNVEANGLFGSISVPEPVSLPLISIGLAGLSFAGCRLVSQR